MMRILAITLPLVILIVLGVGGFITLQALKPVPEESDEPIAGLAVFAEAITLDSFTLSVDAQGEVAPKREIIVSPQIGGRISFISPDFIGGGFIERGQVLVRLEAADYELAVTRARSAVASARQRLAREQAESELAIRDLEDLGITDASPLARREPQLAEAEASLAGAQAQLEEAELALRRTAITAPFSGRVYERNADIGQFAAPGQSLGRIFSTDAVEVVLPLSDEEMGRIGLPLAFAAEGELTGPEVVFSAEVGGVPHTWIGHVTRTGATIDPRARTINVIAEVQDPYGTGSDNGVPMAPGLFVDARIEGAMIENVRIAPRSGLRGLDEVYIGNPAEGTLSIRQVDVLFTDTDGAYILSGVEPGDLAIVSPIQAAFDGMRIKVLERLPDGSIITHEPVSGADTEAVAEASEANEGAAQ